MSDSDEARPVKDQLVERMKPDLWRCSMCGLLGATLVIVPKHHEIGMVEDEDGNWIPLIVKLHPEKCKDAWQLYGPDYQTRTFRAVGDDTQG